MTDKQIALHREMAVECFNKTWDLMEKSSRSSEEDREMIHTAHASLYNWMQAGTPLEWARGEWQVSRVYSVLRMGQSALYHGEASLGICAQNGIMDFDLAFAYEAIARAYKTLGDEANKDKYLNMALEAAEIIADDGDKEYTLSEINSI